MTIYLREEFVDFVCKDRSCGEHHKGMAVIISLAGQPPAMVMQDLNWTPIEAMAALLEATGNDVVLERDM